MSLGPWKVGATFPYWTISFTMDGEAGGVDLTGVSANAFGCTIAGTDIAGNAVHRAGTGTFVNNLAQTGSNKGKVTYQESSADVGTAGRFLVEAFVTLTTGQLAISDNMEFEVVPRL